MQELQRVSHADQKEATRGVLTPTGSKQGRDLAEKAVA